jgi:hypothetical protein
MTKAYARDATVLLGIMTMFSLSLVMTLIFFAAWFNPEKTATIHVDLLGEGNLEAMLIPAIIGLGIATIVIELYRMANVKKWQIVLGILLVLSVSGVAIYVASMKGMRQICESRDSHVLQIIDNRVRCIQVAGGDL